MWSKKKESARKESARKEIRRFLEFRLDDRAKDNLSPLRSEVEIDGRKVVVLPHEDFMDVFKEPGMYTVKMKLPLGSWQKVLYAEPVNMISEERTLEL